MVRLVLNTPSRRRRRRRRRTAGDLKGNPRPRPAPNQSNRFVNLRKGELLSCWFRHADSACQARQGNVAPCTTARPAIWLSSWFPLSCCKNELNLANFLGYYRRRQPPATVR